MFIQLRKTWPYAAALAVAYVAVVLIHVGIASRVVDGDLTGVRLTYLLGVYPAMTFAVAALAGYRHGYAWVLIVLTAVAWVPAVFLAFNESALVYAVVYAAFAALGLLLGRALRRAARRSAVG
ncbi:MAG: hypothetical protein QM713_05620 [Arachnia sp.]